MKYPIKPAPIPFKNLDFGLPEFIDYLVASDDQFNKDGQGIRAAYRIQKALLESKDLSYIPLEDSDYTRVKNAAEEPTKGYPTPTAVLCYHVIQALSEAKDERPEGGAQAEAEVGEPSTN